VSSSGRLLNTVSPAKDQYRVRQYIVWRYLIILFFTLPERAQLREIYNQVWICALIYKIRNDSDVIEPVYGLPNEKLSEHLGYQKRSLCISSR
jgi:hypothetical protein